MPCAKNSLSTVEHTQDIWAQESGNGIALDNNDPVASANLLIRSATARHGTTAERSYVHSFDNTLSGTTIASASRAKRFLPVRCHNETSELLLAGSITLS